MYMVKFNLIRFSCLGHFLLFFSDLGRNYTFITCSIMFKSFFFNLKPVSEFKLKLKYEYLSIAIVYLKINKQSYQI